MIKQSWFLFLVAACILYACTGDDQPAAAGDTTGMEVPADREPVRKGIDYLPLWKNFMEQQFDSINNEYFNIAYTIPLDTLPAYPLNKESLAFFRPYLAYSPDSTKAIDIYSYNTVIHTRDNRRVMMNGGPDSQISLLNLKDSSSRRLFFSGPALSFWDAQWINSHTIIIAGTDDQKPVYWVLDLENNNMQLFIMESAKLEPALNRENFLRRKMPGVMIPG
jgi:hypothetical protein